MSNEWPRKIFVATTALGVYYTENFEVPEIQPSWYAINTGLPSLDVREFWMDPTQPNTYQYLILESSRSIYRRAHGLPWQKVLSPAMLNEGGSIGGFCCDPAVPGRMYAMCGAPGVVYNPNYYYLMTSVDYGATWQRSADAGGGTIWTYGLGSVRAYDGHIYYMTSQNLGAHASINNSWIDWNYVPWCVIDPDNPDHPYTTVNMTGGADLARITGFNTEDWADYDLLQNDLGPGLRCDTMWFDRNGSTSHSRIVRDGHIYSTTDSWATIDHTSSELESIYSICPINEHEDLNQMLVGQPGVVFYERKHVIGAVYGEEATTMTGIAGTQALVEPYASSIPWNCGGIAQNGIQAIVSMSGVRTYAIAMPDYIGPHRGEPLAGDRSAWDTKYYPEKHSRDLGLDLPVHHVPAPNGGESWVYSEDGETWTTVRVPLSSFAGQVRETILTFNGELSIQDNPYRIYNLFGTGQAFRRVFLSVATAPAGTDIIVDIHQDGTTIFANQDNRPRIVAGNTTGYTVDFNTTFWSPDSYLTAHVDQTGSTSKGSYLVVHIVHGAGVFMGSNSISAFLSGGVYSTKHAHVRAPVGLTKSAYLRGPDPETDSRSAYLTGQISATDSSSSYIYGDSKPTGSKSAYVQGGY